jgi:hypothetical protein
VAQSESKETVDTHIENYALIVAQGIGQRLFQHEYIQQGDLKKNGFVIKLFTSSLLQYPALHLNSYCEPGILNSQAAFFSQGKLHHVQVITTA